MLKIFSMISAAADRPSDRRIDPFADRAIAAMPLAMLADLPPDQLHERVAGDADRGITPRAAPRPAPAGR